jgi:fucose permease
MGFGAGTLDMVLSPIVAALQPERRTVAMNMLHSFYCFGAVVTILIGALALRGGMNWRHIAFLLILLPAIVGVGFLAVRVPCLIPEGEERMRMRLLGRERFFLLALVAIFLGGATEISMAYWLPTYAERELHFGKFHADLAFLGFCLAMGIGRIGIGVLGIRLRAIPLMLWCCVLTTGLFLAGSFVPVPMVAVAACILAGLTGSALWPSTLAVAADRFPRGGATMFGILAAMGNFGGIVMPWLSGIIADHSTLAVGLATSAVCPALMIGALVLMQRMGAHPRVSVPAAQDHY